MHSMKELKWIVIKESSRRKVNKKKQKKKKDLGNKFSLYSYHCM